MTTDTAQKDMRGITRCWQNFGWHTYGAGPCFDTHEQAARYRDGMDALGVTWLPEDERWKAWR